MKMKAVNHKPMKRPRGTFALQGGEEVRVLKNYRESKQGLFCKQLNKKV
jgi:hypothetical protein